jgi:hypothetical protein
MSEKDASLPRGDTRLSEMHSSLAKGGPRLSEKDAPLARGDPRGHEMRLRVRRNIAGLREIDTREHLFRTGAGGFSVFKRLNPMKAVDGWQGNGAPRRSIGSSFEERCSHG